MQKPVEGSNTATAPITTRALTVQPGTTPAGQVPYPVAKPTDLETLVAPIARYPDLLLTQLLPASTYPLEVVQAAHWLESKPYLAQASSQGWAPSIVELLRFPQLIFMMNEKLDWTAELGDRFLAEPDSVLAAIQSMRTRALSAGLLKDSAELKATKATVTKVSMDNLPGEGTWVKAPAAAKSDLTRQIEVIRIEPSNAQEIYVPQYNPQLLYSEQSSLAHNPDANPTSVYDSTTSKILPWLTYGAGVTTGALLGWAISEWNDDDWDDHYHGYYRQPIQLRTQAQDFSKIPRNSTAESQRSKTHHSTQQMDRLSTDKPEELIKSIPQSVSTSDRAGEVMRPERVARWVRSLPLRELKLILLPTLMSRSPITAIITNY